MSHITDKDIQDNLKEWTTFIPNIIQKIHYSPEKPENNNIYVSDYDRKKVMLFENNRWEVEKWGSFSNLVIDNARDLCQKYQDKWIQEKRNIPQTHKRIDNFLNHTSNPLGNDFKQIQDLILTKLYTNSLNYKNPIKKYKII